MKTLTGLQGAAAAVFLAVTAVNSDAATVITGSEPSDIQSTVTPAATISSNTVPRGLTGTVSASTMSGITVGDNFALSLVIDLDTPDGNALNRRGTFINSLSDINFVISDGVSSHFYSAAAGDTRTTFNLGVDRILSDSDGVSTMTIDSPSVTGMEIRFEALPGTVMVDDGLPNNTSLMDLNGFANRTATFTGPDGSFTVDGFFVDDTTVVSIPEPDSLTFLGLGALLALRRKRPNEGSTLTAAP